MRPCTARREWVDIVGLPAIAAVVKEVLGQDSLCISMGGDFVLPGTAQAQYLHSDFFIWPEAAEESNFVGRPPFFSVNFAVSHINARDGPLRILPGTHRCSAEACPEESPGAWTAGLAPLAPGVAIIRDVRTWHSGTPNLGPRTRYLPSLEFVPQAYLDHLERNPEDSRAGPDPKPHADMPRDLYDHLSETSQRFCRHLNC